MDKFHYLDNAATTRLYPDLMETFQKYYLEVFANPSSLHKAGLEAERALTNSRKLVAGLIGAKEEQIIFTSGASEANNLVIANAAYKRVEPIMITTKIEHSSVKKALDFYANSHIHYLANDADGLICDRFDAVEIESANLISIILVNNEIGTIQNIKEIIARVRALGFKGLFHTDATQAVGKIPIDVKDLDCDFLTASAHKFKGPKGVGFLYCKHPEKIRAMILGGSQEHCKRAGTENVAGICVMAKALSKACSDMEENAKRASALKQRIADYVKQSSHFDLTINEDVPQSPYILSVRSDSAPSEVLLHAFAEKGIYLSSGSACNSNNPSTSSVLGAIGKAPEANTAVLRISFAADSKDEDVDAFLKASEELADRFQSVKK